MGRNWINVVYQKMKKKQKADTNDTKFGEVMEAYEDAQSAWSDWRIEATEDFNFYLGEQWSEDDITNSPPDYPNLTMNIIKKPVDLMSGYQRQNRTDLKAYPTEGADTRVAEIHTQLMKYTLSRAGQVQAWSQGCLDAFICGLGWVHPHISYKYDKINGDILIDKEDPFRIYPDPYFNKIDLSDAGYIIRSAYISKEKAKEIYPDAREDIENLPGEADQLEDNRPKRNFRQTDKMVNIIEKWTKDKTKKKFLINIKTGEKVEFKDDIKTAYEQSQNKEFFEVVSDYEENVKLTTLAGNLILYDDENPFKVNNSFPFIPIFGYYTSSHTDWRLRIQGLVRKYKDIQREKNKWRSQAMYSVLTKHLLGYFVQEGVNVDVEEFHGGARIVRVSDINLIREIPPPIFPQTYSAMENQFDNDSVRIGENADLIGLSGGEGGSAATAPGVTLQLRQRQGMTSVQEIFDNMSTAYKLMGNYHIELVNKNYSRQKIESICGENIPYIRIKNALNKQIMQINQAIQQMQEGGM